ncbi:unnamed protein product, partial [marine sediment metagenome]
IFYCSFPYYHHITSSGVAILPATAEAAATEGPLK